MGKSSVWIDGRVGRSTALVFVNLAGIARQVVGWKLHVDRNVVEMPVKNKMITQ